MTDAEWATLLPFGTAIVTARNSLNAASSAENEQLAKVTPNYRAIIEAEITRKLAQNAYDTAKSNFTAQCVTMFGASIDAPI